METTAVTEEKKPKKKGKNPFPKDKFENKEWHERLGEDFWKQLHRSAVAMEELDKRLAAVDGPTGGSFRSQRKSLAQGLAMVATLDRDDNLFLPQMVSLASLYRGVTIEHYVGQWLGNLLDPGKGRLEPGNIASEAFHLMPRIGSDTQWIAHAVGLAMAMRLQKHPKLVCVPLFRENLNSGEVQRLMTFAANHPIPIVFMVLDGDAELHANAVSLRHKGTEETDFLNVLKFLKGQFDRVRSRMEAVVLSFANPAWQEQSVALLLDEFLVAKGWRQEETLLTQVQDEVNYGIERAMMIPAPPKSTIVQDLTHQLRPDLEQQWLEWRKVHGR